MSFDVGADAYGSFMGRFSEPLAADFAALPFWRAVRDLDPAAPDESDLPGARDAHLVELFTGAGLHDATQTTLTVSAAYTGTDEWWHPYTQGVGPAGAYLATLEPAQRERVRTRCAELLPTGPFTLQATAWTATGRA
jgi:hypothetical protein